MAARRSRRTAGLTSLAIIAVLIAAGIYFGPKLFDRYGDRYFSTASCTAIVANDGSTLTGVQSENAAIIAAYAVRRDLPTQAATIALSVAIQESGLRNVTYGDRDSLGLFQQRPSQGWGTAEEVSNPRYATKAFYEALLRVDGWEAMDVTVAAQTVQRSGFPDAYAAHEDEARVWATALTGGAGIDAVTCHLPKSKPSASAVEDFRTWVHQNFGRQVVMTVVAGEPGFATVVLEHDEGRYRDALAAWAVTSASAHPIESVASCATSWSRATGEWSADASEDAPTDCSETSVTVMLALPQRDA